MSKMAFGSRPAILVLRLSLGWMTVLLMFLLWDGVAAILVEMSDNLLGEMLNFVLGGQPHGVLFAMWTVLCVLVCIFIVG